MVNLIVGFPIWRWSSMFMNLEMWENVLLILILDVEKFTSLTPLSLLITCIFLFPTVGLKMSSLPTVALKSPNKSFSCYLGNLLNIQRMLSSGMLHHEALVRTDVSEEGSASIIRVTRIG
jgi:hypothetical protein